MTITNSANGAEQLIADDAFAASFQSMGQYRSALLAALREAAPAPQTVAWLATDLDGRGDVAFTKEEAKRRAGEGCNHFYALCELCDIAPAPAGGLTDEQVTQRMEDAGFIFECILSDHTPHFYGNMDEARALLSRSNPDLTAQLEQAQVQLAGCSAAALGYGDDIKQGDYGWSQSFADVLKLRQNYMAAVAAQPEAANAGGQCEEERLFLQKWYGHPTYDAAWPEHFCHAFTGWQAARRTDSAAVDQEAAQPAPMPVAIHTLAQEYLASLKPSAFMPNGSYAFSGIDILKAFEAGAAALPPSQPEREKDAELLRAMAAEWDRSNNCIDFRTPIWDALCEARGKNANGTSMRAAIAASQSAGGKPEGGA